jgi:hypothetical protein
VAVFGLGTIGLAVSTLYTFISCFESRSREAYIGLFIWSHFLSPKRSKSKSTQNRAVQKKYPSQFNNLKETKCVSFNGGSKCIDGIV